MITKFQKLTLSWRYYLALCKPRVILLIVFTAMVGQLLASTDETRWTLILFSTLGIGLAAAAGAAINHWADRRVDAVMARTRNRPLPQSEISPRSALVFALVIASLSMAILFVEVNLLTTVLTFLSMVGYSVIYTLYLKYATP
ncbi:MAG: UbiA family prenyltransferase, partial [Arenicellales bacterium]|nr:UbiA family prenyltransferase [Arenicellales bacterium]